MKPGPPDPEFEVLAARPHTPPLSFAKQLYELSCGLRNNSFSKAKRNESAHVPCQLFITIIYNTSKNRSLIYSEKHNFPPRLRQVLVISIYR